MNALWSLEKMLTVAIAVLALAVMAYALIDALRQRADAFTAAGKLTKPLWLTILGVATAIGTIFAIQIYPFNFFNLIAFVASCVYLADVRPAIKSITGGGNSGPYGRW
ncbi:hypothetical protein GCM10022223_19330 [Kineosporia mesophila]|uniref:DUF2516 family protein n=1 Tax=Kineosporia mesophila TaxID=566012 RepID=A0ABP6ZDN0_9ACTN|nr:DUF2516 family protein [Kineosporia mesophila]MCD5353380.1 DUF2516 family protein [Kineosporia mesophila]